MKAQTYINERIDGAEVHRSLDPATSVENPRMVEARLARMAER